MENTTAAASPLDIPVGRNPCESVDCTWCGAVLDEEEAASPSRDDDGDAICDRCHTEHFMGNCSRCGELVELADLDTTPGQLIALYAAAPVLCKENLEPGYYRILKRPFFADGMIEGHFYGDALQRIAGLDAKGQSAAPEAYCLAGPLCSCCRLEVEASVPPNYLI